MKPKVRGPHATFVHQGVTITNPDLDETGRWEVDRGYWTRMPASPKQEAGLKRIMDRLKVEFPQLRDPNWSQKVLLYQMALAEWRDSDLKEEA